MNNTYLPLIVIAVIGAVIFAIFFNRGPTINKGFDAGGVARSAWDFAGAHGPVLTVIHGNPFAVGDDVFQRKILDELGRIPTVRVTRYTTDAAQAPQPKTRLVLLFDGPVAADGNAICAGRVPPSAPGDKLTLLMALCSDDRLLAEVRGHMARVEGPDNPLFSDLIGLSLRTLINA